MNNIYYIAFICFCSQGLIRHFRPLMESRIADFKQKQQALA